MFRDLLVVLIALNFQNWALAKFPLGPGRPVDIRPDIFALQNRKADKDGNFAKMVPSDKAIGSDDVEAGKSMFPTFDMNGNGAICLIEFKLMMEDLGMDMNSEEIEELFQTLDSNGDGELNAEEFEQFQTILGTLRPDIFPRKDIQIKGDLGLCNNRIAAEFELPGTFPGVVAHGIHSITIPDIHFYFPTDKTDIQMPVVNPDLLSDTPILSKPLDFKHSFTSPALRVIDQALTHMNSKHYDMSLYNDLEKIVHAAHMQDWWLEAGKAYNKMQESNNIDDELCACVKDVENNGIVSMLRSIALKLREPGLIYGENSDVKVATDEQTPYLLPSGLLPHLREVKHWNQWKAEMLTMEPYKEDYSNQLALFMHCALK